MSQPTLAKAWIGLVPTLEGGTRAIEKELGGVGGKSGGTAGTAFGGGLLAGAKKFIAPLAAAFAGVQILDFGKNAVAEASDLTESLNALDVTFKENSKAVQELGRNAADALGLSNVEFNNLAVRFSAFSKTIAGDGGDVVGVLDDLTIRASDFASVMNLEVNEAAVLFQSGLAGETEPLRRFGIDVSAAAVELYALESGLVASKSEMTEAIKVQARYGLLMEQTADAQGDFANTSGELANQQRIMGARWKDLQAQLGTALLPVVTKVVSLFTQAIPVISGIADMVGEFFSSLGSGTSQANGFSGVMQVARDVFQSFAAAWRSDVQPALAELGVTFREEVMPAVNDFWVMFQAGVLPELQKLGVLVQENVVPALIWMAKVTVEAWKVFARDFLPVIIEVVSWIMKNLVPAVVDFVTKVFAGIDAVKRWAAEVQIAVDNVRRFFSELPGNIKSAMSSLADRITSPFKSAFNSIASMWNKTVGQLEFSVPDWVIGPMAGKGWSVPNIPMLAEGGIVTRPTLAMIGEGRGPEAVIPLDRMDEFGPSAGRRGETNISVYETSDPLATAMAVARIFEWKAA